jgi:hypothetical protein
LYVLAKLDASISISADFNKSEGGYDSDFIYIQRYYNWVKNRNASTYKRVLLLLKE